MRLTPLISLLALSDSEQKIFLASPTLFYIPRTIALPEVQCFNAIYSPRHSWTLHQVSLVSLDPHSVAPAPCGRYMFSGLASIGVRFRSVLRKMRPAFSKVVLDEYV
jgi:hypothetical protein